MESLHKIISALRAKICACNERRNENTLRFTMTNRMLLLLFPIFIVCMAELNQDKYLSKLVIFIADHPTIMLFNILIAGLIFLGALRPVKIISILAGLTFNKLTTKSESIKPK